MGQVKNPIIRKDILGGSWWPCLLIAGVGTLAWEGH